MLALNAYDRSVLGLIAGVLCAVGLLIGVLYWVVFKGSDRAESLVSSWAWSFVVGFVGWNVGLVARDVKTWGASALFAGGSLLLYYLSKAALASEVIDAPLDPDLRGRQRLAFALWLGSALAFGCLTYRGLGASSAGLLATAGAALALAGGTAFSYSRALPTP